MNWTEITPAALTLFLIMDPIGNVPVFNALLSDMESRNRVRVVGRELLIALFILLIFLYSGNRLLQYFGLSHSSLNITGGVLLFIISLRMIFPAGKLIEDLTQHESPFIVPLAMPMIAGPSTIVVLLLLTSSQPQLLTEWLIALLLAWVATSLILLASPYLLILIGRQGSRALERMMGMILVILAIQMLLDGIRDFIESL